jgi:hypothetical protein
LARRRTLDPQTETELDRFVDQLVAACRSMLSEGWDDFEIRAMCESAILHKGREMMQSFRDSRLAALRAEGCLNVFALDHVRNECDKLISRELRKVEAGMGERGEVLH